MDPRSYPHAHDPHGQAGLEVVDQHQYGLEVASQEHLRYGQSLPEVRADEYVHGGKESVLVHKYPGPQYSEDPELSTATWSPQGPAELSSPERTRRKKRLWLIIGGVVAVVVIIGAVLGGVLGSRAANSSSGDGSSSSQSGGDPPPSASNTTAASPPSNTTTPPQSIRQGSSLSVTGWRRPDGSVETYLFYQDPKDGLRYSRCDTSRRSPGNDSTCWDAPVSFNSFAQAGTRLAASTTLFGDKYQPQINLFYTGFSTRFLGTTLNSRLTPNTSESSANQLQIYTGRDSALTAYWPWTLYQDPGGVLYHVRNRLLSDFSPSVTDWDNNRLNTTALSGSRLAVVPMSANFSRIALKGGYAVFYQDPSSLKLAVAVTDLDSPQLAKDYPLSWQPKALPDVALPKLAPLAGFSVARKGGDARQRVDTYVLYRDGNADVNVVYAVAASGSSGEAEWKTAQPGVMKGVDKDSDVACLTLATSASNAAGMEVSLEQAGDEARCYFQRKGRVVEVRLDAGTGEWVAVGEVPMP